MIIGVFGISGVGKTTVCTNLQQNVTNVKRISASDIIRTYGGLVDYEQLSSKNVDVNQLVLIEGVRALKIANQNLTTPSIYLLELHNVLETPSGVQEVGVNIFRDLSLDLVTFLTKPAIDIAWQRQKDIKRERVLSSVDELEVLQQKAIQLFKVTFMTLDIPFEVITTNHYENLLGIIERNYHSEMKG